MAIGVVVHGWVLSSGIDFADDLDRRHNVELNAAFFERATLPESLFCEGFYLAGDETLPTGDEQADVIAGEEGEVGT